MVWKGQNERRPQLLKRALLAFAGAAMLLLGAANLQPSRTAASIDHSAHLHLTQTTDLAGRKHLTRKRLVAHNPVPLSATWK